MKSGTISIILGTIGVLFIIWFNYQTYELYESLFLETQNNFLMEPTIVTTGKSYKIISLGMALFGILFGLFLSFLHNLPKRWLIAVCVET